MCVISLLKKILNNNDKDIYIKYLLIILGDIGYLME